MWPPRPFRGANLDCAKAQRKHRGRLARMIGTKEKVAAILALVCALVLGAARLMPAVNAQNGGAAQGTTPEARAHAALATTSGALQAKGLEQPVEVLRDSWGVAHIYAKNQHDLFFAQGWVQAQDRLFQMELWKRAGQGRLAEVLGETAVSRDTTARLLRYRGDMAAEFASYAPDAREILTAFTQGINAYIRAIQQPGGPGLPVEFQIAGFTPEEWKPEDCLYRMPTLSVSGNADAELRDARQLAALGPEKMALFTDFHPPTKLDEGVADLNLQALANALLAGFQGTDTRIGFPTPSGAEAAGSNNWVISGAMSETGKPILANDPHRTIAIPSLRYIVHLNAPGWDVIGATEPGIPGVSIGHNENIAWGITVFGVDQQDLYLEELNPANALEYKVGAGWQRMRVEETDIAVRGKAAKHGQLRFTRHGPVLWSNEKYVLALRWVGAEPGTVPYLAGLSVDRAKNWTEFLAAMQRWKEPAENIVYADTTGNIGEQSAGLTPIRKGWNGLLPVPGNSGLEWSGFVPLDQLPRQFNPAGGFIATANNQTIPDNYPYQVGFGWAETRITRIREVLNGAHDADKKLEIKDMEDLQNDVTCLPAREMIALLKAAKPTTSSRAVQDNEAAKLLFDWDDRLNENSAAAALFEVWERDVARRISQAILRTTAVPPQLIGTPAMLRELEQPKVAVFGVALTDRGGDVEWEDSALPPAQGRDAFLW
jgi:penicillin G amidase